MSKKLDRHGNEYRTYTFDDKENCDVLYFEVYEDSLVEIKVIEREAQKWRAICVDGAAYLQHQIKFEIGRPHLLQRVEKIVSDLRSLW